MEKVFPRRLSQEVSSPFQKLSEKGAELFCKIVFVFADEGEKVFAFAEYGKFGSFFVMLYAGDELIAEPVFVHPR